MAGHHRYACTGHLNSGDALCKNNARLKRTEAEAAVLSGIKSAMSSPEILAEIGRRYRAAQRQPKVKAPDHTARIAQLRTQIDHLADAVASGALRSSLTLASRLAAAETELLELEQRQAAASQTPVANVTRLLTDLPARAARAVEQLEETLTKGDIVRARNEIKAHVGTVTMEADEREIRLRSEQGVEVALLRAAGLSTGFCGSGGGIPASPVWTARVCVAA
jgi:hypothetical protein